MDIQIFSSSAAPLEKFKAEDLADFDEAEIALALNELKNTAFSDGLIYDDELSAATMTTKILAAEEALTKNLELTASVQNTIKKRRRGL